MIKKEKRKVLVFGSSKGIGKSIFNIFKNDKMFCVEGLSSKDFDTSELKNIEKILKKLSSLDVLILNTGGPPNIPFASIKLEDWEKFHRQLF